MDRLCEFPGCTHGVAGGFRLCAACRRVARRNLEALPALYRDCETRLCHAPQGIARRAGRTLPRGIALDEAAMAVRSDILGVLALWCALVCSERGVPRPADRTVESLTGFLGRQFAWLVEHPAAGDFAVELRDLVEAACRAVDGVAADSRRVGPCERPGCGQPVYVSGPPGRRTVRCTAGHVWQPHEWLWLSRSATGTDAAVREAEQVA